MSLIGLFLIEFTNWICLDQFLMSWLFNSISESMLGHVARCLSANEMWNVLAQIFSNKSKEVQFMLQSQEMHLEQQHAISALDLQNPTTNYDAATKKEFATSSSGHSARNQSYQRGRGGRFFHNRNTGSCLICQLCNKPGHVVLKCYRHFDVSFQGDISSAATFEVTFADPQALFATAHTVNDL
ncbi:uncharacterized protein LOC133777858 [Humulus lupulus]|uniref:uncharacterized protein LOC133777858 n=1 Tax=Humulus lupulus TaxID=3486 RepID=UPI002B401C8C|nr:uncharacterized protein LOC133777858 [Humulus lupulus]